MHCKTFAALFLILSSTFPAWPQAAAGSSRMLLQDGTPLKLRLNRNVSSADAKTGDQVDFEVLEDIKVSDLVVVPKGGIAIGTVTEAQPKRRMGRGGKLSVTIDYVRLSSGEKAALRAIREVSGGGHTGAMTGGMVATSLIVWPAAPFFLFMHGKDITIPKGTEITAYINGDMELAAARFQPAPAASVAAAPSSQPADNSAACCSPVLVSSTPPGADIEVDGSFVGSTPSIINMPAGEHQVVLKKKNFRNWERKMKASGGSIKIEAELEPLSPAPR